MAKWQFTNAESRRYPSLGFTATYGDVLEADTAPDALWESVDSGTAATLPPADVSGYTEPAAGTIPVYNPATNQNDYQTPAQLAASLDTGLATLLEDPDSDLRASADSRIASLAPGLDKRVQTRRALPAPNIAQPRIAQQFPNITSSNTTHVASYPVELLLDVAPDGSTATPGEFPGVYRGKYAIVYGGPAITLPSAGGRLRTSTAELANNMPAFVEVVADSPRIGFKGAPTSTWIEVDGELVNDPDVVVSASGNSILQLTWPDRRLRHYRLFGTGALQLSAIMASAQDTVYAPPVTPIKVGFLGDSFMQVSSTGLGIAQTMARLLGWAPIVSAEGGTGYEAQGPGDAYLNFQERLQTLIDAGIEALVLMGGINDTTTAGVVHDAAASIIDDSRTALGDDFPVFVFGEWESTSGSNAARLAEIAAAASETGSYFIDVQDWLTGTGNTSSVVGDGNSDVYRSSDGLHPNEAGAQYLGARAALAVRDALAY